MILSILIPTLTSRKESADSLYSRLLEYSTPYRNHVEILLNEDNGELSIGTKRNELSQRASGTFSCFIDDDDDVPSTYFDLIFGAIRDNPSLDCIGFKGQLIWINTGKIEIFKHSVGLPFSKGMVDGMYLRPPNHLNPMLTDYFREIGFTDKSFGEDYDFCIKLAERGLIKNEVFIDDIMYYYKFNPVK